MQMQRMIDFAKDSLIPLAEDTLRTEKDLQPVFYIVKESEDGFDVGIFCPPSFSSEEDKDMAAAVVHSVVQRTGADAVIFMADSYRWLIDPTKMDDPAGFKKNWPEMTHEERDKYGIKEECIQCIIESKYGRWMGWKSYKRDQGDLLFDKEITEQTMDKDWSVEGRFVNFIQQENIDGQKRPDDSNEGE